MRRFFRRYQKVLFIILLFLCLAGIVYIGMIQRRSGSGTAAASKTFAGQAMGTAVKKTLFGADTEQFETVNGQIDDCLDQFEKQVSVRVYDSEIAKCNRMYAVDGFYYLSDDVLNDLAREMEIYKSSKGAFSPCIRPISDLWGIEDGNQTVPDDKTIRKTLQYCNPEDIELKEGGVVFHSANMALDFGAAGKGIAGDKVYRILEKSDLTGAVVSIGGTIVVYGSKGTDKEWHVGIQDPRGENGSPFAVLDIEGGYIVSTSGDYEKYFEQDGKRYHHIFDPATGYPADSGLMSVSIISKDGFLSDALSTACFVMGLENGMKYAREQNVEAIFVTTDQKVYVTKGIRKNFRIQVDAYELEK